MAEIDINDVDPISQYTATAAQTNFTYNYPIRSETDLDVYKTLAGSSPDDSSQILIVNVDYTVTGVGVETGGEVVLTAGAASGDVITIYRNLPMTRNQTYATRKDFDPETFDRDFNNIIMMLQQVRGQLNTLSAEYQKTALIDSDNLNLPVLPENYFWKKGANGIVAALSAEDAGATTLRSELANNQTGTDGSLIVGHYSSVVGSTTVHAELERVLQDSYGIDTGSTNAYQVALSPAPAAYYSGYTVKVKIANPNTTTSTHQVNSLGAKTIVATIDGVVATLPASALIVGMIAILVFDVATDQWQLINPNLSASAGLLGEVRLGHFIITDVPGGWIFYSEGTIGNASSGATVRANADTLNLYTFYWDRYSSPSSNVICEVIGGPVGASAAADFAADRAMWLPRMEGRAIGVAGATFGHTGHTPASGEIEGAPDHTLSVAELASHNHTYTWRRLGGIFAAIRPDGPAIEEQPGSVSGDAGSDAAHNNLQPSAYMNAMIKL